MKLYFLIYSLFLPLGLGLVSGEEKGRNAKILYYKASAAAPKKTVLYSAEGMVAESELPTTNFSANFKIPKGDLTLVFAPTAGIEAEELKGFPSAKIPEAWNKILFLVFENKKNKKMPIQIKAIDASDSVFAPGSIYMINFSKMTIGGTVGDKKVTLEPKKTLVLKNPIRESGFYPAVLRMKGPGLEEPQRFLKQMWGHHKNHRRMLFILPDKPPYFATYYMTPIKDL